MSHVLIRCPHCGYSKKVVQSKIPPTAKQVKCPECGQAFELAAAIEQLEESQATPLGTSAAPARSVVTPPDSRQQASQRQINFSFHGTAKDYFGIWIVNILLKIVTLGIYSPWAKVRKRSYFYGCTQLEGLNFDYLANPIALLKGWLIAAALFLLYFFGSNFSPILSMVVGVLIYILMPWAIVRSRRFNNHNSAHRNIRFSFYPDYNGAYFAYFWLPMVVPLTLGLAAPYMICQQKKFLVENNSFGKTSFKFFAASKDFYMLFLRGLGIIILAGIGSLIMTSSLLPLLHGTTSQAGMVPPFFAFLIPVFFGICYLFVALYFYVRLTNLTWDNTRLGKHRFKSSLKVLEMCWLFFSNGVAILLSFGLLTPWATVRLTRYRLENLTLIAHGSLEEFEAFNRPDVNAVGEEIGDLFDLEIGL